MADQEVADTLEKITPGVEVELELADGSTVSGRFTSLDDGQVVLEGDEGEQRVTAEDVDDVVVSVSSEGPE